MLKATQLALPGNQSNDSYTGFGVSRSFERNRSSDGSTRRLWYKGLDYSGGQSISYNLVALPVYGPELPRNSMVWSYCGNGICSSIGTYIGGLG